MNWDRFIIVMMVVFYGTLVGCQSNEEDAVAVQSDIEESVNSQESEKPLKARVKPVAMFKVDNVPGKDGTFTSYKLVRKWLESLTGKITYEQPVQTDGGGVSRIFEQTITRTFEGSFSPVTMEYKVRVFAKDADFMDSGRIPNQDVAELGAKLVADPTKLLDVEWDEEFEQEIDAMFDSFSDDDIVLYDDYLETLPEEERNRIDPMGEYDRFRGEDGELPSRANIGSDPDRDQDRDRDRDSGEEPIVEGE